MRRSLPPATEVLAADRQHGKILITRDEHGVPRIAAANDRDAFFAMGYVQAQDRSWQLEIQRRFAQGRLSELLGASAIDGDIWMRTINLYGAAAQAWPALSAEAQASLQAYAAGVNAWQESDPVLPMEFVLAGAKPQQWTPVDSLALVKVFALGLAGNHQAEIERFLAEQSMTADKIGTFFPDGAGMRGAAPAQADQAKAMLRLSQLNESIRKDYGIGGRFVGSNAWAISGKLTKDGAAILANDPHLNLQIPSFWYPVQVAGGRLQVAGMTIVGLPIVVFGQNGKIAWGGTNMMADVQDLYVEQTDPANPFRYREGAGWQPYAMREEVIKVRPDFPEFLRPESEPVRIRVRTTGHGPIISDAISGMGEPVALSWVGLEPGDATYDSFLKLNYASNWAEFNDALRSYRAPALNLVYADKEGNIGYLGIGKIPVRAKEHGQGPVPGWTGEYRWTGSIPFDQLPRQYNPPKGYIASANDNMPGPDYPYFISANWAPRARIERIQELIDGQLKSGRLAVAQMQAIQADTVSLPARKMLGVLSRYTARDQRQAEALNHIRQWDGNMSADSVAATIFNEWMSATKENLFSEALRLKWARQEYSGYATRLMERVSLESLVGILSDRAGTWCANTPTRNMKSCDDVLSESLNDALDRLEKLAGTRMTAWKWATVHDSVYRHVPFSQVNLLRRLFEKRIGTGGSTDTINVANGKYVLEEGYVQDLGAGFRQIIQMGGGGTTHHYMNSTGMSGNIFSEHYADMIGPFNRVQYYALPDPSRASRRTPMADAGGSK